MGRELSSITVKAAIGFESGKPADRRWRFGGSSGRSIRETRHVWYARSDRRSTGGQR